MLTFICARGEDFWTWSSLLCGNHLGDLSAWLYPF